MSGALSFARPIIKMAPKRPDVVKKQQRVKKILDEERRCKKNWLRRET